VLATAISGADGVFRIAAQVPELHNDKLCLRGRAEGFGVANIIVQAEAEPEERFFDGARGSASPRPWLVMFPPISVRGTVVNDQDEPIAGVSVTGLWSMPSAVTDAQGKFEIGRSSKF
jgi:hypothetical protein